MLIDDLMSGRTKLVKEDIYRMDKFFANVKALSGINKINEYPNLNTMIKSYKIKLNKSFMNYGGSLGDIIVESVGEFPYQRTIDLPNEGEYYNLIWDIEKLTKIINKGKLRTRPFLVSKLMKVVDKNGIDTFALENAKKNKKPIIVGYFPQMYPYHMVLDGNHRVMSRYKRYKWFIEGYELSPQYLIEGFTVDIFKELFLMHFNMYLVIKYISGMIDEKQLKRQMVPLINNLY